MYVFPPINIFFAILVPPPIVKLPPLPRLVALDVFEIEIPPRKTTDASFIFVLGVLLLNTVLPSELEISIDFSISFPKEL